MLRRIVDAHDGKLPDGALVIFANTGREHEGTLEFVRECGERFGVEIEWVEYDPNDERKFRVVDFATADRTGKPFRDVIETRNFVPNTLRRICTQVMKVETIARFAKWRGVEEGTMVVGLRADEPRRVHRVHNDHRQGFDYVCPMAQAGHTINDVNRYWSESDFDLQLPNNDRAFGNCDLCFLKGRGVLERVLRHEPERAQWWIDIEESFGHQFRNDRPTYRQMLVQVNTQPLLYDGRANDEDDDTIPCTCTD